MKKLLTLTMMLFAFASFSNAQCPAPSPNDIKVSGFNSTTCEMEIKIPNCNYAFAAKVYWSHDGVNFQGNEDNQGLFHYTNSGNPCTLDIYLLATPYTYSGMVEGDYFYVVVSCGDGTWSAPTGVYRVKFKGGGNGHGH